MKKFIVETYYTCTFKTTHTLNELNDKELSKIDSRNDGEVEVIDVKLNNRKTKKIGDKSSTETSKVEKNETPIKKISEEVIIGKSNEAQTKEPSNKLKNSSKERFRMPDRRKGYIQKASIGEHKA